MRKTDLSKITRNARRMRALREKRRQAQFSSLHFHNAIQRRQLTGVVVSKMHGRRSLFLNDHQIDYGNHNEFTKWIHNLF